MDVLIGLAAPAIVAYPFLGLIYSIKQQEKAQKAGQPFTEQDLCRNVALWLPKLIRTVARKYVRKIHHQPQP